MAPTCAWACIWPVSRPRALLNRVLDRLPGLALDPGDTDPHIQGDVFRSPTSLPVTFRAARLTAGRTGRHRGPLTQAI